MAHLQFITQCCNDHTKRCYSLCHFFIILKERLACKIDLLTYRFHDNIQFIPGIFRELSLILMHITGHICNIRSMISDTFKVIDRMQIKRNLPCLCCVHLMLCKLDQIITQTAFILIDQIFLFLNLVELTLLVFIQKIHCTVNILTKLLRHTAHCSVALTDRKCRIRKKTLFQKIKVCFIFQFFCAVFYEPAYQLLKFINKRKQNTYRYQTEHGVQQGNRYRRHNIVQKIKMDKCIDRIESDRPDQHSKGII